MFGMQRVPTAAAVPAKPLPAQKSPATAAAAAGALLFSESHYVACIFQPPGARQKTAKMFEHQPPHTLDTTSFADFTKRYAHKKVELEAPACM